MSFEREPPLFIGLTDTQLALAWPSRAANSGGQLGRAAKVAHGGHKVPTGGLTNGGCQENPLKNPPKNL